MISESNPKLVAQVVLRPSDAYEPFVHSWQNIFRWLIVFFVSVFVYDAGPVWFSRLGLRTRPAVLDPVVIVATFVIVFGVPWLRLQWMFSRYPVMERPRSYTFGPEGMHIESEESRGDYNWSLFTRIAETRRSFIFMVTPRGGIYLPKRCLAGTAEVAILRKLIRENFKGKRTLRID